MLRASVLCRNMSEICRVWGVVEELQTDGSLEGTRMKQAEIPKSTLASTPHLYFSALADIDPSCTVIIVKNRFRGEAHDTGYRDLNIVVAFEGFLCEIQVS